MSKLSHESAKRLIHKGRLSSAERLALSGHLRTCAACRRHTGLDSVLRQYLVLEESSERPSPQFTADFMESAARSSRRSHIMKPIYAVGGTVALALLILAGWFIIRSNIQTKGLVEAPELPPISISESQATAPSTASEESVSQPEIDPAAIDKQFTAAVEAGEVAEVERLLETGANPDFADKGIVPLPFAAKEGQTEIIRLLLEAGADVDSTMSGKAPDGDFFLEAPALLYAAAAGHLDVVELLLANGADPNLAETEEGETPLHSATWFNHTEIMQALIENGAEVNVRRTRYDGMTPLHWAVIAGWPKAAEILILAGAEVNIQDLSRDSTPLLFVQNAPADRQIDMVSILLDHGADPDAKEEYGNTELHIAAADGKVDIVKILLQSGASIDMQNDIGKTALHRAAEENQEGVVKFLIDQGATLNIEDNLGQTALDVAPNEQIAEMLSEAGATGELQAETVSVDQQLVEAVAIEDATLVNQLLDAGANPNVLDDEGNALLPLAAKSGELEIVRYLLDAGADINGTHSSVSAEEGTALIWAALRGHVDVVRLLISNGADLDRVETLYNRTALHAAAWFNNFEIVTILLESGADPNLQSTFDKGKAALHFSVENAAREAVQALLDGGADADIQTTGGVTPMMMARDSVMLTILLEGGANPNMQDNEGNTALHRAALANNNGFLSLLIEHGADVGIKNLEGQTALDLATDDKVIETLRQAGAKGGS